MALDSKSKTMEWKVLSQEYISNHKYFKARKDVCEMPDGTKVDSYFVVEIPVSVVGFPITADGKVIMVKQYRHAVTETLLEIPGGFVDPGENLVTAMHRELLEETGYKFDEVVELGKVYSNPGMLNSYTYMFLATGGIKVAEQDFDPHENMELILVPLEEVIEKLRKNQVPQSLHTCCIFYGLAKMGKLSI